MKNNPKGYWFKRKTYGWGWVPSTWQGWLIILIFIGILMSNGFYFVSRTSTKLKPSPFDLTLFTGIIIISIIAVFWVCYKKGEKPRWSWGK